MGSLHNCLQRNYFFISAIICHAHTYTMHRASSTDRATCWNQVENEERSTPTSIYSHFHMTSKNGSKGCVCYINLFFLFFVLRWQRIQPKIYYPFQCLMRQNQRKYAERDEENGLTMQFVRWCSVDKWTCIFLLFGRVCVCVTVCRHRWR